MSRLVLLDTGTLSLATNPKASDATRRCNAWLRGMLIAGVRMMAPEITAYELRRDLIRGGKWQGLANLDTLAEWLGFLPVTTEAWRQAAVLWAQTRNKGQPTASDPALDGDVILAAQAQLAEDDGYEVIVATDNVGHLGLFVDARLWETIGA